ncbi:MAG: nucleotide exchange factor GrpE [Planctomycetota bacterium]|jgi:molecular chaperone GrpE
MGKKKKIIIPTEDEVTQYGQKDGHSAQEESQQGDQPAGQAEETPKPEQDQPSAETKSEADQWKEKYLRAKADLANYQRRAEKNQSEALRYANARLAKALLPIIDDLQRVITTEADRSGNAKAILDGVKLTLDNFLKMLREFHIVPIEAEGKPFDPNVHEAVMEDASVENPQRTVLKEVAKGYQLHDRVLRPARVTVSKQSETIEEENHKQPEETKEEDQNE